MCTNTPTTNTYHHNDVIELASSRWKVGAVTATAGSSEGGGGGMALLAVIPTAIESLSGALAVDAGAYPSL